MAFFEKKKNKIRGKVKPERNFLRQFLRGGLILIITALFFTALWYITRLNFFTISQVTVLGGETIAHEEVRARVMDELQGTYFLIIPKRFSYLYPHERIVEVVEKIPRAHEIVVTRASRTTLNVSFKEYIPHALWCTREDVPESSKATPCYFIDAQGYAFTASPMLQGGTFVRHIVDDVEEVQVGTVIEPQMLGDIDTFIARVSDEFRLRITSVLHKKNGDIELHCNGGGMIFVSGKRDFRETFENLKSVLLSPEFKHLAPGNFKYIDVRFDNKVFVNEELEPIATTTATTTLPES